MINIIIEAIKNYNFKFVNEPFKITDNKYTVNIHSNNISCIIKMIDKINKIINIQIDRPTYIDSDDRVIISEETINGLHIVSYGNLTSCIDYESV